MSFRPTIYLGRWFGVEIRLDWYVVVFIGILFLFSLDEAQRSHVGAWTAVAHLVLLCVMLFCIFLHEVGHAAMVKLRGHRPRMIMLSFVGFTFFEAKRAKPIDETLIALAGPATNAVIGVLLLPFVIMALATRGQAPMLSQASLATWTGFLATLSLLNFVVAFGNLMPLWPMDGARAVRGMFAARLGFVEGTERAVSISHGLWLISAGVSVALLTVRSWLVPKDDPASSPFSMLLMYQFVMLLLAAMGIYYGWAEVRRVRAYGKAAENVVGPPPEFEPKGARQDKPSMLDAEVVSGGRPESEKPQGPTVGEKITAAKNAATAMWAVAKLTGKGAGWFAKQSIKAAGEMMKDKDKKDA